MIVLPTHFKVGKVLRTTENLLWFWDVSSSEDHWFPGWLKNGIYWSRGLGVPWLDWLFLPLSSKTVQIRYILLPNFPTFPSFGCPLQGSAQSPICLHVHFHSFPHFYNCSGLCTGCGEHVHQSGWDHSICWAAGHHFYSSSVWYFSSFAEQAHASKDTSVWLL